MPHSSGNGSPARVAALITLMALRSIVANPEEAPTGVFLILPDQCLLDLDDTAAWLAEAPKPTTCIAYAAAGMLAIGMWRMADIPQARPGYRDWHAQLLRDRFGGGEESILLLGCQESLLITADELGSWFQSYDLPLVEYDLDSADPIARQRGAAAALRFQRTGGGWSTSGYST